MVSIFFAISGALNGCMLMHLRGDGCMGGHGESHAPSKAACPVCGVKLKVADRTPRASHAGKLYYFDNEEHLREFLLDPDKFLHRSSHEGGRHGE